MNNELSDGLSGWQFDGESDWLLVYGHALLNQHLYINHHYYGSLFDFGARF